MKKLIASLLALSFILSSQGAICYATNGKVNPIDNLVPKITEDQEYIKNADIEQKTELESYGQLVDRSFEQIIKTVIKTILYLAGALVVIGLLVVGVMFMTGSTSEENLTKARKVLMYIGIGVLIISVSYALITGIMQIDLFN